MDADSSKTDLFNWACWVYGLMTGRQHPLVPFGVAADDAGVYLISEEGQARQRAARKRASRDWPMLRNEQLGLCIVRAWKGEYESAQDALQNARSGLLDFGRELMVDVDDEIARIDWKTEFEK